jgi:arabinogalactan oligomer/maltooligosaccharide transport system permease protein
MKTFNIFKSAKTTQNILTTISYFFLAILTVIWLYPILWIILNALRTERNDLGQLVGIVVSNYWPRAFGLDNYVRLFTQTQFPIWLGNTIFVSFFTFIFSTFMQLSVAYVMSKIRFKARRLILRVNLILGLFPGFMSIIAIYYILKSVGLTQNLFALIIIYSAGAGLGFYVGKGFFDLIPNSLIEAARIDGATNFQIFMQIILPISKPIIIYTALMSFIGPWMDFIFARVILGETNTHLHTVSVGLYSMIYGPASSIDPNRFTVFASGSVIVAIPIVILFLSLQKFYVEGATSGAVKG